MSWPPVRKHRVFGKLFLSLIFFGILPTLADACVLNGQRYRLASDTVHWSLELSGGQICIRGVRFNNVVVDKLILVSAPQIGQVTLQGTGFSYKAASHFQGRDFFTLMVSGATNKISWKFNDRSRGLCHLSAVSGGPRGIVTSTASARQRLVRFIERRGGQQRANYQSLHNWHSLGRERQRAVALELHRQQWHDSPVFSPRANWANSAKAWAWRPSICQPLLHLRQQLLCFNFWK